MSCMDVVLGNGTLLTVSFQRKAHWLLGDFSGTTLTNLAMCSPFPSVEAFDGYKRWLFEILNPPLLGVLVRITFIDSIKFPLHLSSAIPLRCLPVSIISLHTFSPILILFCCSCSHSPPASLQNVFYPSYYGEILGFPKMLLLYLISLSLQIVAWLSFI